MIRVYGIKQCSSMQKAFAWLDAHAVSYEFHDYKKLGADPALLAAWADELGWEVLLNTRGTTWRKLDEQQRSGVDRARAIALMQAYPSLIKRPVITGGSRTLVGFDENALSKEFA